MVDQSKRIEKELRAAGAAAIRRLQLRSFQALTSATPVDTGFARAGWTPSVGSAIAEPNPRPAGAGSRDAPGPNRGAVEAQASSNLSANQAKALQIAATYRLEQGSVFLTNAVPYVVFLNEGSSSQAPSKFVERALSAALLSLGGA